MKQSLVVLGSGGVGKSAITVRYINGIFVTRYDPTIEDSYRKQVVVTTPRGERQVMLEILDTAGTEQFAAMRDLYYSRGEGFILVYSMVARSTFEEVRDIAEQLFRVKDGRRPPVVLAANKCDLADQRVVSREDGEALARELGATYVECSALTTDGIVEAFDAVVTMVAENAPDVVKGKKRANCTIL